jgi:alpha-maltose-1-phosphate synthase
MPRVAYICADPGVPVYGTKGASVHVQEVVRAWRRRGAEVHLYCTRVGDDVPDDLRDVPVTHVPVDPADDRDLDRHARTAAREHRAACAAARLAEAVVADGADVVYERYSLFSLALSRVCRALAVPGILEVNAPLVDEQRTHRHLVDEVGAQRVLQAQVTGAAVVTTVSRPVADWVLDRVGHEVGSRVLVVPNGVDPERIRPVQPVPGRRPVVVFVGTLKPWHGVDVLVEAAARARVPWRLRLVGDGPERHRLCALADRLGVELDLRGAVPPAAVPDALAGAMVAVAPYPAEVAAGEQYFSPLKVYEYGAAALPVVASRVGQLPDVVEDGVTGLLVTPSDPQALADALDALVADPARAAAMGAAARERMVRHHSWDAVLEASAGAVPPTAPARRGRRPAGVA